MVDGRMEMLNFGDVLLVVNFIFGYLVEKKVNGFRCATGNCNDSGQLGFHV